MELICKVTDEDIGEKTVDMENSKLRLGARGIVIREDGKIAIFNKSNKNEYKLPGGGLEGEENPEDAFKREVLEETGCDVELNGVCYIANRILEDDLFVMIVFNAKLIKESIEFDKEEILDVKWFDYDEIVNKMDNMLRESYVRTAVMNQKKKLVAPINIVNILKD